jgi:hypothetical protein
MSGTIDAIVAEIRVHADESSTRTALALAWADAIRHVDSARPNS